MVSNSLLLCITAHTNRNFIGCKNMDQPNDSHYKQPNTIHFTANYSVRKHSSGCSTQFYLYLFIDTLRKPLKTEQNHEENT